MAEQLSEDDIKFFLSLDPDEEAVRKAIEQINSEIESAKVKKIKLDIESALRGPSSEPETPKEPPGWMSKLFKSLGGAKGGAVEAGAGAEAGAAAGATRAGAGTAGAAGAGAAAAGPIGAVLLAIQEGAKLTGKIAATSLKAFTTGLTAMAGGLRDLQGPLGGIGAGLHLVSEGFELLSEGVKKIPIIGSLLGPVLDQLKVMPKILGDILATGLNFASKANPGVMRQLSIAMEDAMATIGQAFIPVVEEMIPVMREIGTTIAQALPSGEEMRTMFRNLFESIKELIQELAPLIGPLFKGLVGIVQTMVKALTALASAFKFVYEVVRLLIKGLTLGFVDLGKLQDESDPKKRGAISAARTPFLGSIEEFQRRLQMQTAQGPRSMGPESVPQNVNKMAQSVGNIEKWFQRMSPEEWKKIVKEGGDRNGDTRHLVNQADLGLQGI